MKMSFQSEKYIKFIIYTVAVVLVNLAASTLFFRFDLTENKLYSLSDASKAAVAKLSEPLTINVFFTENLPAPHNSTQRYLRDMLEEYALYSNKYFNYRFYDVSPQDEGGVSDKTKENQKLAENYGIQPVEIRMFEKDEVKFKKAYMGMVLIQGDVIERIPAITSTDGLEYKLTTTIDKLNKKISTLTNLPEKIHVKLFMSSSLDALAPIIGIKDLPSLPESVKHAVDKLNAVNYGKLVFERVDPATDTAIDDLIKQYNIRVLQWQDIPEQNIRAGRGAIGLVLDYKNNKTYMQVMNVMRIPIIGTRYELIDGKSLEETINKNIESLIGINEDVGYLADHGTLALANPMMGMQQPQGEEPLQNFQTLVNENYNLKPVMLKDGRIPENLRCLIIAQPKDNFTDYELYQIDQALMRGTNLAIFTDGLKEIPQPQQQQFAFNMGPTYQPLATGLEKLLDYYGVRVKPAYILDKNCFKQQLPPQAGGGERPIYFAPIIKNEFINHDLDFMNNIKGMVALNASPVLLDNEKIKNNGLKAFTLAASSNESWEMSGQINLNPMLIQPPQSSGVFKSIPFAALIEGDFPSYFKNKEIPRPDEKAPEKPVAEEEITDKGSNKDKKPDTEAAKIQSKDSFIATGKPGKICIIGSSALLKDNLLDTEGTSPNAAFILNLIDTLNGRDEIAAMRSKVQQFNPLEETTANVKNAIKIFNIAGLPIIIVLFGLIVWWRRSARRKNIRLMFQK